MSTVYCVYLWEARQERLGMKYTRYAIVIVTCNRINLLQECIEKVEGQTAPAEYIVIVNNASTDGTREWLGKINDKRYDIINLEKNIGGAGGFAKGIEAALQKDAECVLIIDDDAIIDEHYLEKLIEARNENPNYKAFAGTVTVQGKIDTFHRRNMTKVGFLPKQINQGEYNKPYFICDIASFCGMLVDTDIIKQIGLPHAEYFIWYDDTEYSLRINKFTKFMVVPEARLNHKTKPHQTTYPRRYDWREYYAVRNRILMVREHGNVCDRAVNYIDLFINVIFRNWLFGVIRKDGYDWKYEKGLVKKAVSDAHRGQKE
jgi:hypothetical protein